MTSILKTDALPYCKGCGHDLIAKNMAGALENLGFSPLDVIVVTDIGCHGIIDRCLNTHTVHGLHGRSVALGAGIALGQKTQEKKIIVLIGDGGSTIGLQHILEAARLNLNMTVVVHNNMLYGMTGGQTSGLTPCGFNTNTSVSGNPYPGYDICALSYTAGAKYVSRIAGIGNIKSDLEEAFGTEGFSLVEVIEICPSYGLKLNPKRKLSEIIKSSGRLPGRWENDREAFTLVQNDKEPDLFEGLNVTEPDFVSSLKAPVSVIISGSAGEGVQLAAGILATAAIRSGCHVTQKGSYPVTVGVGFSTAELVISPETVGSHGLDVPDIALITSADGLAHCRERIMNMGRGLLFIDTGLDVPSTGADVYRYDFRSVGARSASIYAVFRFSSETGHIPVGALLKTVEEMGLANKIPLGRIRELTGYLN